MDRKLARKCTSTGKVSNRERKHVELLTRAFNQKDLCEGCLKPSKRSSSLAFCRACGYDVRASEVALRRHSASKMHKTNVNYMHQVQGVLTKSLPCAVSRGCQGTSVEFDDQSSVEHFQEVTPLKDSVVQGKGGGMVCVILVAGHAQRLSLEIEADASGKYSHLKGVPKALLPGPGNRRILDFWWDAIKTRQLLSDVYIVTNADKYKHFERWATASDFPVENVINDGSTLPSNCVGAVSDFELALHVKNLWSNDVLVIAGDMLFQDCKFDMAQVLDYFHRTSDGDLAIYYEMHESEATTSRGIVEVCLKTNRILRFLEKPESSETESRYASVVFYAFRAQTVPLVSQYLQLYNSCTTAPAMFGSFMQWLINDKKEVVYGMKLPTGFQLIGQVGLKDYESWISYFVSRASQESKGPISHRAYARIGLMGNPSDGFYGKTISLSISNFWAEVRIAESASLHLMPNPLNDPTEFGSLADLYGISRKEGYLGGLRLLQATCKKFYHYCTQRGIALARRNFTLSYETNIPRQVGLAGSSAIVTATLKCLMDFFNLTNHDMPLTLQPQFVLDVEKEELCINAGLQDRVVQIYEGLVYMDFSPDLMKQQGCGSYRHLNIPALPPLFLAYLGDPSDSGKIHSDVSMRWYRGDEDIKVGMQSLAELTDKALIALQSSDWPTLGELMKRNFAIRRQMYGDLALGEANLRMIDIGTRNGAFTKFPGSGGAVTGLLLEGGNKERMKREYQSEGCVFVDVIPRFPEEYVPSFIEPQSATVGSGQSDSFS